MPQHIVTIITLLTTLLHLSSLISVTKGGSTTQTFSTTTTTRRNEQPPSSLSLLTTAPTTGTEEEDDESTIISIRGGGGSNDMVDATVTAAIPSSTTTTVDPTTSRLPPIEFVFSDVDGTLVHQPPSSPTTTTTTTTIEHVNTVHEDDENHASTLAEGQPKLLHLPPSSTGNRGVISAETLVLCRTIRQHRSGRTDTIQQQQPHSTRLVLVSGMRTSTLWKRLPYLPKADAYASESGGRIFYPVPLSKSDSHEYEHNNDDDDDDDGVVRPVEFYGAKEEDLHPFRLVEDMEWRRKLSQPNGAGIDGYRGDLIDAFVSSPPPPPPPTTTTTTTQTDGVDGAGATDRSTLPLNERSSALWDFANDLVKRGFVVDCDSYATCFRVDRRKQRKGGDEIDGMFRELIALNVKDMGLARSVNLGCVDFYPIQSGKKNCCAYLAQTLSSSSSSFSSSPEQLSQTAVCLCDDDNDIEMALACRHAYLPTIASESMAKVSREYSDRISVMMGDDKAKGEGTALLLSSTKATEDALRMVLEELGK